MARIARVVIPGLPHHVTQRGNRRQPIFFEPGDQAFYRKLLAERCRLAGVAVWAYCLMPNHVHLIMVPEQPDSLARALGETHRRYTSFVNARSGWTGHLFQGRFSSVVLDDGHLVAAARYVVQNPVRARLAKRAQDWPWSSARAHQKQRDDGLVQVAPLLDRVERATELIGVEPEPAAADALRAAETIGRPVGAPDFIAGLEARLGRRLQPQRRGPKPKAKE